MADHAVAEKQKYLAVPYKDEKGISETGEIESAISISSPDTKFFELIGAHEDIWPTRNRRQFYRFIPSAVGEISIRDTVHQDAQYPNQHTLRAFQDNPDDTEEAQIMFVSALTASAFGLAATGALDYAWNSFENGLKKVIFFNARRK